MVVSLPFIKDGNRNGPSKKSRSYRRSNFRRAPAILLEKMAPLWYLPCRHKIRGLVTVVVVLIIVAAAAAAALVVVDLEVVLDIPKVVVVEEEWCC